MTFKTLIRNIEEREREREGFSLNFHDEGVMIVTQCTRIPDVRGRRRFSSKIGGTLKIIRFFFARL